MGSQVARSLSSRARAAHLLGKGRKGGRDEEEEEEGSEGRKRLSSRALALLLPTSYLLLIYLIPAIAGELSRGAGNYIRIRRCARVSRACAAAAWESSTFPIPSARPAFPHRHRGVNHRLVGPYNTAHTPATASERASANSREA